MTEERRIKQRNRSVSAKAEEYNTLKISQILYSLRIKLGHRTQAECANLIGFPTSVWARHEKGNIKLINLDFINKICETFGYNIDEVLVKKEPKTKAEKLIQWASTEEARPYLEKAYKEYKCVDSFGWGACQAYSLEIFNDEDYKLFSNDVNDDEIAHKLSIVKNGMFVNELNGEESDILLQIIKTVENAEIEIDLKRSFLNKILHSNKIKLFNTSNLSSIQNILSEEEYNKFVEYLYSKIDLKQITAYSNSDNKNIIFYESLRTLTEKPKYL